MARKILALIAHSTPLSEIARETGLPLYRVRSAARELADANLTERKEDTYALTEAGRLVLAQGSGKV